MLAEKEKERMNFPIVDKFLFKILFLLENCRIFMPKMMDQAKSRWNWTNQMSSLIKTHTKNHSNEQLFV